MVVVVVVVVVVFSIESVCRFSRGLSASAAEEVVEEAFPATPVKFELEVVVVVCRDEVKRVLFVFDDLFGEVCCVGLKADWVVPGFADVVVADEVISGSSLDLEVELRLCFLSCLCRCLLGVLFLPCSILPTSSSSPVSPDEEVVAVVAVVVGVRYSSDDSNSAKYWPGVSCMWPIRFVPFRLVVFVVTCVLRNIRGSRFLVVVPFAADSRTSLAV